MKTALLQSYRTAGVPDWLHICMDSVRNLAMGRSWTYRFWDDSFFDLIPASAREKLTGHPAMMSDLARLILMQKVLEDDADLDRAIWLDADVYVFRESELQPNEDSLFTVGRQVWVQGGDSGGLKIYRQVHNAFLAASREVPHLDFLIWSIRRMIDRMDKPLSPQMFGPKLLTALHNIVAFDVCDAVGMASPLILNDLARGGGPALDRLAAETKSNLAALNLCSSYRDQTIDGVRCSDILYEKAIAGLNTLGEKRQV